MSRRSPRPGDDRGGRAEPVRRLRDAHAGDPADDAGRPALWRRGSKRSANISSAQRDDLAAAGLPADRIALDPGIGFGKRTAHNLALCPTPGGCTSWAVPCWSAIPARASLRKLLGDATADPLYGTIGVRWRWPGKGCRSSASTRWPRCVQGAAAVRGRRGMRSSAHQRRHISR